MGREDKKTRPVDLVKGEALVFENDDKKCRDGTKEQTYNEPRKSTKIFSAPSIILELS